MTSTRPAKPSACLVPSYYDGFLEKMENRSQKYKRYWTVLRGNELFFQVTSRDPMYIEKINLEDFMSVEDDEIYNNNLQHILILKLKSGDIKLKADSLESQVQWKSFIHTVTKLEIPNLILLPGQIWRLREVLEQEIKRRRKLTSSPPPLPPPRDQNYDYVENISSFYKVSRMEAESLLAKNIEFGNLLMRPSSDGRDLSVSTRQAFNKGTIVKHYRIRCVDSGYIIDIDEGVLFNSRQEIVNYFIQQTNGVLKPLEIPTDYEINLSIVEEDAESGELIHRKLDTLTRSATKTLFKPVKKGKQSPKKPVIIEPETGRINNNEIKKLNQANMQKIKKLNQANMQRIVKVELQAHLKIEPSAMPRQPINLPGLTNDVTKELNEKLQQRRATMSE